MLATGFTIGINQTNYSKEEARLGGVLYPNNTIIN